MDESINQNHDNSDDIAMKKAAEIAIDYATDFGVNLDYSSTTVEPLENILDEYSNSIKIEQPSEIDIWRLSALFGAYLGEVMLRNGLSEDGYRWGNDDMGMYPVLIGNNDFIIAPIDKVFKRLVNGAEDSVISFFDAVFVR
ncbi:MAG: hypothetical protein IJ113_08835 [Eggerthellaceae bacterium]|nr:hypothetical protein [Eggerthellaceae bacterium]